MMVYCHLHPQEQSSVKFKPLSKRFHSNFHSSTGLSVIYSTEILCEIQMFHSTIIFKSQNTLTFLHGPHPMQYHQAHSTELGQHLTAGIRQHGELRARCLKQPRHCMMEQRQCEVLKIHVECGVHHADTSGQVLQATVWQDLLCDKITFKFKFKSRLLKQIYSHTFNIHKTEEFYFPHKKWVCITIMVRCIQDAHGFVVVVIQFSVDSYLPIFFRVASLALGQSYASEATLKYMTETYLTPN